MKEYLVFMRMRADPAVTDGENWHHLLPPDRRTLGYPAERPGWAPEKDPGCFRARSRLEAVRAAVTALDLWAELSSRTFMVLSPAEATRFLVTNEPLRMISKDGGNS